MKPESSPEYSILNDYQSAGKVNFLTGSSGDYLSNETYKTLRTNLFFCGADVKTVVITSCNENEGKSTVSSELSKSLADAGKRTLMIDADMRKSMLLRGAIRNNKMFGLSEYLTGQAEFSQILYNTQIPNFDIIFSGHFPPNPVELLGSDRFKDLLAKTRGNYDYIIIDSPPLGSVIDSAVIASVADGAIMVLSAGKIHASDALDVKTQLTKSGCRILGVVLNNTDPKNGKYYKKYCRSYGYGVKEKK